MHLKPDVVPARVIAGVGNDRGGAVIEGEQSLRGGDVAELGEEVVTAGAPGGVDLDHFSTGDPPHRVEVVDCAVAEDSAGDGDVLTWGWWGVQGGGPYGVNPTDSPARHRFVGRNVSRFEAAGVSHLH